jgi:hypothetical protein
MDKERRDYLLSLGEEEAALLPRSEWYDRVRLFREIDGAKMLEQIARDRVVPLKEKTSSRAYNEPTSIKDGWLKD